MIGEMAISMLVTLAPAAGRNRKTMKGPAYLCTGPSEIAGAGFEPATFGL